MTPDDSPSAPRVSDAEREAVIGQLREGYAQGRLGFDEFSERLDRVMAARTGAELATLDIPSVG